MEQASSCFKFFWKLENFCFCDLYCNSGLSSPKFTLSIPFQCQWYLYTFPNGHGIDKYVGIFLKRSKKDSSPKEIRLRFRISLVDESERICLGTSYQEKTFVKGCEWGWNEFIKRSELKTGSEFLSCDTLIIRCDFSIISFSHSESIYYRRLSSQFGRTQEVISIRTGMKFMYEEKRYSDIILRGNERNFNIHRCILKARLPALFNALKSCPDRIFSNDFATEKILSYAYTGKLDFNDLSFLNIGKILSDYGLDHLQSRVLSHHDVCTATTYFTIQKRKFSWIISIATLSSEEEITSPLIPCQSDKIGFMLVLNKSENNELKIKIKIVSNDDVFVRCKVSVNGQDNIYKELEHLFNCNKYWQFDLFIQLMDDFIIFGDRIVPIFEKHFILDFVFTYPTGHINSNLEEMSSCFESSTGCVIDDSRNLLLDMEELYNNNHETDMAVIAGNKEFNVHKCILAARSPVFRAMIKYDMIDKNRNQIVIEDPYLDEELLAKVVDKLLLYTYCGKFDAPSEEFEQRLNSMIDMYFIGGNYEEIDIT